MYSGVAEYVDAGEANQSHMKYDGAEIDGCGPDSVEVLGLSMQGGNPCRR